MESIDSIECRKLFTWYSLDVYISESIKEVKSKRYNQKVVIIVPFYLIDVLSRIQLETVLWNEVTHIYYKDKRDLTDEYRADKVAIKATSIKDVMSSLEVLRYYTKDREVIDKRISHILLSDIGIQENPFDLLASIGGISK